MTLSNKTFQQLAAALTPEVIEYIFNDERWIEFMQETVPDAIKSKLGQIDEDVLYELSLCIIDRVVLTKPNHP